MFRRVAAFILFFLISRAESRPLHLYVDWYASPEYAGMLTALNKNWYREAGIDLKIHFRQNRIAERVTSSPESIGLLPASQFLRVAGRGVNLRAFAAHLQFSPETVVVPKDSSIESLGQLRGKRLGISDDVDRDTYQIVLSHVGLTPHEVTFVRIPRYEETALDWLAQKKVDALLAWEFHWPLHSARRGTPLRQFPAYRHGFYFYGEVFVARRDQLEKNRDLLARFLSVTRRGWREVYNDPATHAKKLSQLTRKPEVSDADTRVELALTERFLFDGIPCERYGQMTHLAWERSFEIAKKNGLIPISVESPKAYYDLSVLNRSLEKQP